MEQLTFQFHTWELGGNKNISDQPGKEIFNIGLSIQTIYKIFRIGRNSACFNDPDWRCNQEIAFAPSVWCIAVNLRKTVIGSGAAAVKQRKGWPNAFESPAKKWHSTLQNASLRRIFTCIGPNQKNQPSLDLYLVRRYTICHFPIVVSYLCICQNQKNEPNLVLYLVRRNICIGRNLDNI